MSKTAIRPKHSLEVLNERIADAYAFTRVHAMKKDAIAVMELPIPLWVAEELKQALEKQ